MMMITNITQLKHSRSYRENYGVRDDSKHVGRLKLLTNDFSFINQYIRRRQQQFCRKTQRTIVVYFGAAPGYHIPYLIRYFGSKIHRWILIDPSPLARGLAKMKNVINIRKCLRPRDVENLRHHLCMQNGWTDVIMLSDIRTAADDCSIRKDNRLQNDYYFTLKPNAACLKLRFPFDNDDEKVGVPKTSFDNWKVQAFPRLRSTELRLWLNTRTSTVSWFDRCFSSNLHDKMCVFNMAHRPYNDYLLVRNTFRRVRYAKGGASLRKYINWLMPGVLR